MNFMGWNPFGDNKISGRDPGSILERSIYGTSGDNSSPRVDVYQTDHEIIVKAEIPGVSKEDMDVYIDKSSIRLSGHARRNNEFKDEHNNKSKKSYGSFSRLISLPAEIKTEEARAEYRDGIVSITASKSSPGTTESSQTGLDQS